MSEYRPLHQTQLDDDPRYRWVNCNVNAAGMAVDKDSLALVRTDPDLLRRAALPDTDGLTLAQTLDAVEEVYGWELSARWLRPDELAEHLEQRGGAMLQIVRQPLGDYCGSTFNGTHSVYVQEKDGANAVLFDPLCPGPRRFDWNRIVLGGLAFGAILGRPTQVQVALTRPGRSAPSVRIKGKFWRYTVSKGVITGRTVDESGGMSANCTIPVARRWPRKGTSRTLVRLTSGSRNGWYVEPLGATVRYIGEP